MAEFKLSYTANEINNRLGAVEKTIRYDKQNLTEAQKKQVKENIGAIDEIYVGNGDMPEGVTIQILTDGSDAEQELKDELKEYIDGELVGLKDSFVTPQMYGAKGDGTTDDTAAFESALAANGAVFLPKGKYLITRPIDLTQAKSLYSYNQDGVIKYTGTDSVILLGRRSRISGVKILVSSTNVDSVFNTDNRRFSGAATLMTEVNDIEVYFDYIADTFNTTLINLVASNKDYLKSSGFHNQNYSDIRVAGVTKIKYGIKICVSFDASYVNPTTDPLPWITDIRFNHIWLGSPECAIKIYRENNSGTEIDYNSIVRTEHMMFNDIATQCTTDGHVKYFYDVEYCMAEFINCQPWDYHHVTTNDGKYNIIGRGALLSEVNARRSPIDVAMFPSVTATTPETDPAYFLRTFFNFQSNIDGKYDYINMKCDEAVSKIGIDEDKVESIAQRVIEESMNGIYTNVMLDPLTTVYTNKRFSHSSSAWVDCYNNDALIIPIKQGTNLIRWQGNELSAYYMSVFFSNDLITCVRVNSLSEWDKFIVVTENDTYLPVNNTAGYKYCILPFIHTDVSMDATNMTVTINEIIGSGALNSVGEHINNTEIHITAEDRDRWNNNVGIGSTSETWTFVMEDNTTVTKKVVLV